MTLQELHNKCFHEKSPRIKPGAADICMTCRILKPILTELVFVKNKLPSKANMLKAGIKEEEIELLRKHKVFGENDANIFINWSHNKYNPGHSLKEFAESLEVASSFSEAYTEDLDKVNTSFNELAEKLGVSWHWVRDRVAEKFSDNFLNFDLIYSTLVRKEITNICDGIESIEDYYELRGPTTGSALLKDLDTWCTYRER